MKDRTRDRLCQPFISFQTEVTPGGYLIQRKQDVISPRGRYSPYMGPLAKIFPEVTPRLGGTRARVTRYHQSYKTRGKGGGGLIFCLEPTKVGVGARSKLFGRESTEDDCICTEVVVFWRERVNDSFWREIHTSGATSLFLWDQPI